MVVGVGWPEKNGTRMVAMDDGGSPSLQSRGAHRRDQGQGNALRSDERECRMVLHGSLLLCVTPKTAWCLELWEGRPGLTESHFGGIDIQGIALRW